MCISMTLSASSIKPVMWKHCSRARVEDGEGVLKASPPGVFPQLLHMSSMDFDALKRQTCDEQDGIGFHMNEVEFEMGSFSNGDPYPEPDVCRGISMPAPGDFSTMCGGEFYEPDLALQGMGLKDFPPIFGGFYEPQKCKILHEQHSGFERFSEGTPGPPLADPEVLLATTLMLKHNAVELGNAVIDWMQQQTGCSISKVSPSKSRVKADYFADHRMCTLKISIYKMPKEEGLYALEFCRRSGDATAFAEAYKQLSLHLSDCFPGQGIKVPERMQLSPPPLPEDEAGEFPFESVFPSDMMMPMMGAAVQPLLDMANSSDSPHLQAESASALASLAEDHASAEALCSGKAFESFKKLLDVRRLDVAYPVACLLMHLAQHKAAQDLFVDEGLLPLMAAVVQSRETMELVKRTMARALAHAMGQCAPKLAATAQPHFDTIVALESAAGLLDETAVSSWDFARRTLGVM